VDPLLAQAYRPSGRPLEPQPEDEVAGTRFLLFGDRLETEWIPGGFMPDGRGLGQDTNCKDDPHGGKYCIRVKYKLADNSWVGVGWLWLNLFSDHPRRPPELYKAVKSQKGDRIVLRFWARSKDRAWVKFQAGGGNGDSVAFPVNTDPVWRQLESDWQRLEVDLSKEDLTGVIQVFGAFLDREHNSDLDKPVVTFDLDDVYLVKLKN